MGLATLGGVPFRIDPTGIEWSYSIKTSSTNTVGGKVVQVFGTQINDMTVTGKFSSWQEQKAFMVQVKAWVDSTIKDKTQPPLRFTYSPRNWDFLVYISNFDQPGGGNSVALSPGEIAPPWSLTMMIVEDNGGLRSIKEGVLRDYIERLATGIGWKRTKFNGPLGDLEVQQYITGQGKANVEEVLSQ